MTLRLSTSWNATSDTLIAEFRQRTLPLSKFLLAPTSVCPATILSPEDFVRSYTFSASDLAARIGTETIVHTGKAPDQIADRLHLLYKASPIIYAHRDLGAIDLTLEQIRDVIEGRIEDWRELSSHNVPIRPCVHKGAVQKSVFRTVAERNFGVKTIRGDLDGAATYEGLTHRGATLPGALVFGLRPEFTLGSMLKPISIGGTWPGAPVKGSKYPSQEVWLAVPDTCDIRSLARYLEVVACRMERDVAALRKIAVDLGARSAA